MAIKRRVITEQPATPPPAPKAAAPVTQPVARQRTRRPAPVPVAPAPDINAILSEPSGEVVTVTSTKHRRLKDGVNKVERFERAMTCSERDLIIRWWNQNQRLVPKEDPVCISLAKQINEGSLTGQPISSMQVAGYLSYLCRMGQWTEVDRIARFRRTIKRGAISAIPLYSQQLINAIIENWEREREDERVRAEAHAAMRAANAQGKQVRVRTTMQAAPVPVSSHTQMQMTVPVAVPAEDESYSFTF